MMPLREELFALSGMMLKTWIMSEIEMVSGRPVARRMEISDQLRQNSRTVFSLEEVSFGVELESEIFTRRWLERNQGTAPRCHFSRRCPRSAILDVAQAKWGKWPHFGCETSSQY